MPSLGDKTNQIVKLHETGVSIDDIAIQFGISARSVEKRLSSYKKINLGLYPAPQIEPKWNNENIKEGFDRFISENGRLPTAYEIDDCSYLPSARQIQRRFGGLSNLREALGYEDLHFGKGKHRVAISQRVGLRGGNAEDELNGWLIDHFGEPFVHSERRFGDKRNRVDFLVYAKDYVFGIDVFSTDDKRYVVKNIGVKLPKYLSFPTTIPLFFVVAGDNLTQEEVDSISRSIVRLAELPMAKLITVGALYDHLKTIEPLALPDGYTSYVNP